MNPKEGQIYNDGRLRLDASVEGDLVYVRFEGRFDPRRGDAVARALTPYKGDLALDLNAVTIFDTPFVMFLQSLKKRMRGRVHLVNPPPRLMEMLELAGADGGFKTIDISSQASGKVRRGSLRLERAKELEKALSSVRDTVRGFFPRMPPKLPSFKTAFVYLPSDIVGGDFFGFVNLPDDRFGIFIGDVTGHGIEAAVLVGMVKKVVEIWAKVLVDPIRVLARVNDDLCGDVPKGMFITAIYGVLDTRSRTFQFVRAGHNLPLVFQRGATSYAVEARGLGLCISRTPSAFRNSLELVTIKFEPDMVLLLYTDGLVEAENSRKEEFGLRGLMKALEGTPPTAQTAIRTVMNALYTFKGDTIFADDITAIAISLDTEQKTKHPPHNGEI